MSFLPSYEERDTRPDRFSRDCEKYKKFFTSLEKRIRDYERQNKNPDFTDVTCDLYDESLASGLRVGESVPVLGRILHLLTGSYVATSILEDPQFVLAILSKAVEEIESEEKLSKISARRRGWGYKSPWQTPPEIEEPEKKVRQKQKAVAVVMPPVPQEIPQTNLTGIRKLAHDVKWNLIRSQSNLIYVSGDVESLDYIGSVRQPVNGSIRSVGTTSEEGSYVKIATDETFLYYYGTELFGRLKASNTKSIHLFPGQRYLVGDKAREQIRGLPLTGSVGRKLMRVAGISTPGPKKKANHTQATSLNPP